MSLRGSLEDVSVVDVIQFIHIGGRTGTLSIKSVTGEALIAFQRGRIVNVWRTAAPRLGELLVAAGAIDERTLARAVSAQDQQRPRPAIGQLLIAMGAVSSEAVREILGRHFSRLVRDIVSFRQGTFEFSLDDVLPLEDLAAFPGDVTPKVELDTQMLLLDALTFLDEIRRGEAPADEEEPTGEPLPPAVNVTQEMGPVGGGSTSNDARPGVLPVGATLPRIQIVTVDAGLAERIRGALHREDLRVSTVAAREAGSTLTGEAAPIVVVDLRNAALGIESIRSLRRTRPRASVVAYCDAQTSFERVYEAGATAAVLGDAAALAACVQSVVRTRGELSSESIINEGIRDGFARLRRIVSELRSGLLSTTVSLNLMNAVAESLERAVLFVIQQDQLIPLGAFGLPTADQSFAELSRTLQVSLREPSVFAEVVETGRPRCLTYEEANLPAGFRGLVSRPRSGEIAVFPVAGSQRVLAAIYVDNGGKDRPITDMTVLDLAAFQLGLALENEYLRRARETDRSAAAAPLRKVS